MPVLAVTELFVSIQGESTHAGRVCAFIRLSGCNLRCRYCDTAYAWYEKKTVEIGHILNWVKSQDVDLVEITGGEPLCQDNCGILAQELLSSGYEVLIETNGSRDISALPAGVKRIVDYKLPGSGEHGSFLPQNIQCMSNRDELKCVISSWEDYCAARDFVHYSAADLTVVFSPEWKELPPRKLAEWIVADRLGVRLGIQLHKVLWENEERGV
jgi:7-carboxy-7-deazaguanine synthase